jgi:dipeptidyl aminopeptidase/acylaminoacyl peptidase
MKRLLCALVLLTVACGNGPAVAKSSPTAKASAAAPSPSGPAFPSPTPGGPTGPPPLAIVCTSQIPTGHQLALVTIRGVQGIVVRDVTDLTHPVTRCALNGGAYLRFVSETKISYIVMSSSDLGASGALYLVDLNTSTTSLVRAWSSGGYASWVYAWSPDGQKLSYLSSDATGVKWHLLSAAGDRVLASLGTVPGRGVNLDNDDAMVGFSADGQYVAVEETFTTQQNATGGTPPIQIVRLSDAKTIYTRADGTMATWGATTPRFYFRTTAGVLVWDPTGKVQPVNPGLQWIRPWPSVDGIHITFSTLNPQGNHVVGVIDANGGPVALASSEPRANPGFLTSSLVWYAGEVLCTTTTPCGLGGPGLTGKTYLYDLAGVESGSVDSGFYDSWPHVAGQA